MISLVAKLAGEVVASADSNGAAVRIGRGKDCALRLDAEGVELQHAEITSVGDIFVLRAVGAAPVKVNGEAVSTHCLNDGDSIAIGGHTVAVSLPWTSPKPTPTTAYVVKRSKGEEEKVPFGTDDTLTIGSGSDCDVVIRGWTKIPRRLALVVRGCGGHTVMNFSAKARAVKLNGEPVELRRWLADGDELVIGGTTLTFREEPA